MAASDDFGLDDDDTEFIAAATQLEASQNGNFQASPRATKRRRLKGPEQIDGASSDGLEWSQTDREAHSPAKRSATAPTQKTQEAAASDEPEEDTEYYFPGELGELEESEKRNPKYKIHIPKNGGQFEDQIFTQTQHGLDDSPSRFRGAVWKRKPLVPPAPVFSERAVNANSVAQASSKLGVPPSGPKQTTLIGFSTRTNGITKGNTFQRDAILASRLQAKEKQAVHSGHKPSAPYVDKPTVDISEELADLPSDAFSSSQEQSPRKEVIEISSQQTGTQAQVRGLRGPQHGLKQMTIFGQPATQDISATQAANKRHAWPLKSRDEPPTHHKLEEIAMETWTYPTNLGSIRDYQYNIVARSLFHNTLVALPTGLGKTFIASTVMLNYYRWTKDAQIVFMAPTKPLIAQQMDACYHIVGIPRRDTVLMTGETPPAIRAEEWLEKRVFFMTPQTVINDLKTGICDPKKTVLVVVDEAHKATGGYAYTEVIKFYRRFNNSFRVHALTATPGSTVEAVQAVIDALGIARVELRTEQSLDIRQYTHEKHTETQLFDISDEQALIMDHFSKALRPVLDKLCTQNAYWSRDPLQLSAYGLTQARQKWMASEAGRNAPHPVKGMVNTIFTVLSSLAHNNGLLRYHGISPFYSGVREFQKSVESGQNKGKYAMQIAQSEDFTKMMATLRMWTNNPDFIGHPKLEYLREIVLNHFLDAGEGQQGRDVPPSATRVMIFASYRDSTEDICRVLKRGEPMIRPHVFVGQAASKGQEGMHQKRQNAVIQDFKSGKYNTLIATSIGEEGLDIGTVDLIVCYDASGSPIRMLQRMGRTGRKRLGKVVLLLMRGKEENDYAKAQDSYLYIQKSIADASKYDYRDEESPRILPKGVQPVVDKRMIDIPVENSQPIDLNERGRRAKGRGKAKMPPKKFHMPDGVRTGFIKASKLDSDDEGESEGKTLRKKKTSAKRKSTPAIFRKPTHELEPEPELVQIPFLEDVLLNSVQERDRERKYAHTADDDADIVVRAPDPTRFPDTIKQQGPTKVMRHGKASKSVAMAMRAISEIDDEKVRRMRDLFDMNDLQTAGSASTRLVSPVTERDQSDEELPDNPLPLSKTKASSKPQPRKKQAVRRTASVRSVATTDAEDSNGASVTKKPRGRPSNAQKIQGATSIKSTAAAEVEESSRILTTKKPRGRPKKSIQRITTINSVETNTAEDSDATPAANKPRGCPKKKRAIERTTSYGSAAAEGEESTPEPTPANMRLATQGIDLGSDDTSGEDEDEEPDSELAEFIVKSDQPIEMANSSQQLPDDTQPPAAKNKIPRRLVRAAAPSEKILSDSEVQSEESDPGLAALADFDDDDDESVVEELPAPVAGLPKNRKRRVVVDDDDDSDV